MTARPEHLAANGAIISDCGLYRYRLWRRWDDGPTCVFVMLNPSTADSEKDDPTIRRCIGFAKREGCGRLEVVNLFAFRATSPAAMKAAADPVGPDNDFRIREATNHPSPLVIAAWGAHGSFRRRAADVGERFGADWMCLGFTAGGQPKHPLYVRGDAPLMSLSGSPVSPTVAA